MNMPCASTWSICWAVVGLISVLMMPSRDFPQVAWSEAGQPSRSPLGACCEHLRIAQWDIVEFSVNPQARFAGMAGRILARRAMLPPSDAAWKKSVQQFRRDLKRMQVAGGQSAHRLVRATSRTVRVRPSCAKPYWWRTTTPIIWVKWFWCGACWGRGRIDLSGHRIIDSMGEHNTPAV